MKTDKGKALRTLLDKRYYYSEITTLMALANAAVYVIADVYIILYNSLLQE